MNFRLHQTCTYWPPPTPDGYGGGTYGSPVEIDCRWEDGVEEVVKVGEERLLFRSRVFMETDVEEKGFLLLGSSTAANPRSVAGAREIVLVDKIPSLGADQFLRTAYVR